MMEQKMTKPKLLRMMRAEREHFDNLLEKLDEEDIVRTRVECDWSVKDILAHISVWEQRMIRWLNEAQRGETPVMPAPGMTWDDLDELNAQTFRENRNRSLEDVLQEFNQSFQEALQTVQSIPEDDLIEPDRYEWRKGKPLWFIVGANTFWHYKEHAESIHKCMAKSLIEERQETA
ncbi:MAG: ClbS/DfsB family four-helix bundle protein [Anaerolineales bacterium]|jgi:hypothetical protein